MFSRRIVWDLAGLDPSSLTFADYRLKGRLIRIDVRPILLFSRGALLSV